MNRSAELIVFCHRKVLRVFAFYGLVVLLQIVRPGFKKLIQSFYPLNRCLFIFEQINRKGNLCLTLGTLVVLILSTSDSIGQITIDTIGVTKDSCLLIEQSTRKSCKTVIIRYAECSDGAKILSSKKIFFLNKPTYEWVRKDSNSFIERKLKLNGKVKYEALTIQNVIVKEEKKRLLSLWSWNEKVYDNIGRLKEQGKTKMLKKYFPELGYLRGLPLRVGRWRVYSFTQKVIATKHYQKGELIKEVKIN